MTDLATQIEQAGPEQQREMLEAAYSAGYERGWADCQESMTEAAHKDAMREGVAQYAQDRAWLAEAACVRAHDKENG